ncbi:hypothetical protein [Lysobacter silvisoli]|uniref:Nuclear transport factor 2 family protein n=1 Tax=Lysobacter silvisoli TaxID=2293254 RepID=A0A371K2M6_9GAMM|nr:hypothetical protein [Lysobacter silvisoli]RDZ28181.1 hypothetical protein DX914_03285 [Lysobacter silvisoli]
MNTRTRLLPHLAAIAGLTLAAGAQAGESGLALGHDHPDHPIARYCARQFDIAQRMDMESFRDYDADTFRAVHDERAITVFGSGATRIGIDAIMATFASHFANREALWSWTERYRVVDGCNSAFILYETVYEIPRIGYRARALTGVTYTYNRGKWLAVADQGTPLP